MCMNVWLAFAWMCTMWDQKWASHPGHELQMSVKQLWECWDPKPGLLAKQYCAVSLALDLPFLEFYDKMKHIELVWMRDVFHSWGIWTLSPQLAMSGKVVELLGGRALLEKLRHGVGGVWEFLASAALCLSLKMSSLSFLLWPQCLLLTAVPPCHHGRSFLWNWKPESTFSPVNCFSCGVLITARDM